jgi:hypothetical protein
VGRIALTIFNGSDRLNVPGRDAVAVEKGIQVVLLSSLGKP